MKRFPVLMRVLCVVVLGLTATTGFAVKARAAGVENLMVPSAADRKSVV